MFNLAALLGLGAVVAGRIRVHRKVVVLAGAVAMCVAGVCLAVVLGLVAPVAGLVLALVTVSGYAVVLGAGERGLARLRLPPPWISWLRAAVTEEEAELEEAIRPGRGRPQDVVVAALALVVVVASVTMERAASALGNRFAVPEIIVGGLVLAAVTSPPDAVAAVYLAARGRGTATLSTALNSNNLNVTIGLLLPAALIGLGRPTGQTTLIAAWYIALTGLVLVPAYRDHGIRRDVGVLVIAAYLVFAGSLSSPAGCWHLRMPRSFRPRPRPAAARWLPSSSLPAWYWAAARVAASRRPRRRSSCLAGTLSARSAEAAGGARQRPREARRASRDLSGSSGGAGKGPTRTRRMPGPDTAVSGP